MPASPPASSVAKTKSATSPPPQTTPTNNTSKTAPHHKSKIQNSKCTPPHNHPDITADPISKIILERDHLRRTITTIRNLFPSEIFRPKNQHLHTRTLQLRETKNALGLLLDHLRADHAHARHPQQREYLTTRISTIYDLLKTLRHAPHQS